MEITNVQELQKWHQEHAVDFRKRAFNLARREHADEPKVKCEVRKLHKIADFHSNAASLLNSVVAALTIWEMNSGS